ncbi:hypothetical protein [Leeuwenhoekiella sp. W20_SRS_FM14]|uniref:hypothetical protein n=1 Tax=Leeuwenhoekiella sp. W20_SRS_FM14 TaxID=3240270 RepID=UPI003F9769DB
MKSLKGIFDFYINSSIHVALAVLCLALITQYELHLENEIAFNYFIFFGAITGYNFVKYATLAGLHHRNLTDKLKIIQLFSFLCFVALLVIAYRFEPQFWISCIPLALLTLLYALPFLPHKRNLRMVPTLKIFIIAAVWAGVTAYLPVIYNSALWTWDASIITIQRFLLVLALIVPFEIRDAKYDSPNLGTLPQLVGIKKTKLFGLIMITISVILEFFKDSINPTSSIIHYMIIGITAMAILRALKNQNEYYSSFFVEGIPILWYLLLLLFS